MPKQMLSEEAVNFYNEELCERADELYRFAYLVSLNRDVAQQCVGLCFDQMVELVPQFMKVDKLDRAILSAIWLSCSSIKPSPQADTPLGVRLASFSLDERLALAAVDLWGLDLDDAATALKWERPRLFFELAHARRKLSDLNLEQANASATRIEP